MEFLFFVAQSWFETEKQNMETENTGTEELFDETLQPSVPTGSEDDICCQVCREPFVQFYNDEKEEWHLRPAISFESKNFHPLCLEDHKVQRKSIKFLKYIASTIIKYLFFFLFFFFALDSFQKEKLFGVRWFCLKNPFFLRILLIKSFIQSTSNNFLFLNVN